MLVANNIPIDRTDIRTGIKGRKTPVHFTSRHFHLDYICAEIGECSGANRTGGGCGRFQHSHASERPS